MPKSNDKYNLYTATIEDCGRIISMENAGGCVGYMSEKEPTYYETILYVLGDEIVDINNPKRVINPEIKVPSSVMPKISRNGHLYTVMEDSLVNIDAITNKNVKSLKRTKFNNQIR